MISKELLSEVMPSEYSIVSFGVINGYMIIQYVELDQSINIHELAHKVKEWAWRKYGYQIVEQVDSVYVYWFNEEKEKPIQTLINNLEELEDFDPRRTFDAGQWVLENR